MTSVTQHRPRTKLPDASTPEKKKKAAKNGAVAPPEPVELNEHSQALADRLKEWCSAEAKRLRLPPYFILNDRTLRRVAATRPRTMNQLLAVDGMEPSKVEKFRAAILELGRGE